MENEIYEKDYTCPEEETASYHRTEMEYIFRQRIAESEFVRKFDEKFKSIPRMINPKQKTTYNRLLNVMDGYAMKHNGHIKGIVDYKNWSAHIYITLPFFEFTNDEDYELLKEIRDNSYRLTFSTTDEGFIRLSIAIEYFYELENVDELVDKLYNEDEQLREIRDEIRKAQVEEVLNMPHVKAFLKRNAEATGLTEKEVFDRMMEIIEKEPERVEQWFKDQQAKIDGMFPNFNDKK